LLSSIILGKDSHGQPLSYLQCQEFSSKTEKFTNLYWIWGKLSYYHKSKFIRNSFPYSTWQFFGMSLFPFGQHFQPFTFSLKFLLFPPLINLFCGHFAIITKYNLNSIGPKMFKSLTAQIHICLPLYTLLNPDSPMDLCFFVQGPKNDKY